MSVGVFCGLLEAHYIEILHALGTEKGMLGQIFTKAQNKIQDPAKLARLMEMLDATDRVMLDADTTGGIHAAALFDASGRMLAVREDIGRHNAVDKLIGHALATGIEPATTFMLVSGRVSFEIM